MRGSTVLYGLNGLRSPASKCVAVSAFDCHRNRNTRSEKMGWSTLEPKTFHKYIHRKLKTFKVVNYIFNWLGGASYPLFLKGMTLWLHPSMFRHATRIHLWNPVQSNPILLPCLRVGPRARAHEFGRLEPAFQRAELDVI